MIGLLHEAEDASVPPVPHVKGRAFYGGRRGGADEFKRRKGSRETLQRYGAWSDSTTPDQIYADQEAEHARREARDIRAQIRGEVTDSTSNEATEER